MRHAPIFAKLTLTRTGRVDAIYTHNIHISSFLPGPRSRNRCVFGRSPLFLYTIAHGVCTRKDAINTNVRACVVPPSVSQCRCPRPSTSVAVINRSAKGTSIPRVPARLSDTGCPRTTLELRRSACVAAKKFGVLSPGAAGPYCSTALTAACLPDQRTPRDERDWLVGLQFSLSDEVNPQG